MATDAEGNPISIGYQGYLVFEVVGITSNGTLVWQGGLDATQTVTTPNGANVHRGKGNWPGVP